MFTEECENRVSLYRSQYRSLNPRNRTYRHTGKNRPIQSRRRNLDLSLPLIQHDKHIHLSRLTDPSIKTPQILLVPLCQRLLLRRETRRIVSRELEFADTAGPRSRGGSRREQTDRGELSCVGDAVRAGGEVGRGARGGCFREFGGRTVGMGDGGTVSEGESGGRCGGFGREEGTVSGRRARDMRTE